MISFLIIPQLSFMFVMTSTFTARSGSFIQTQLMKSGNTDMTSPSSKELTQIGDKPTRVSDTAGYYVNLFLDPLPNLLLP